MNRARPSPMRVAYARVGMPLWVCPDEAEHLRLCQDWSKDVCRELGDWFARCWSMVFVAGYRGVSAPRVTREHAQRMLERMGYAPPRRDELVSLLLDNLQGLYRKGEARASMRL